LEPKKNAEFELNLKDIINYLIKGIAFILAVTVVFTVGAFVISRYIIDPTYSASVKFYASGQESNTTYLNYYRSVTPQYIEFLNVTEYYEQISQNLQEESGISITPKDLKKAVTFSSIIADTSSFYMTVETEDATLSYQIARAIAKTAPDRVGSFENVGALEVISYPQKNDEPVSPSILRNTALGFILGLVLSCGLVVLRELLDNRIREPEEITELFGLPVFGVVPEFSEVNNQKGDKK